MSFAREQSRGRVEPDPAGAREVHFAPCVEVGEIRAGSDGTVEMHRAVLLGDQAKAKRVLGYDQAGVRRWLRGRPLGCYCPLHQPCHADTLLAVANG